MPSSTTSCPRPHPRRLRWLHACREVTVRHAPSRSGGQPASGGRPAGVLRTISAAPAGLRHSTTTAPTLSHSLERPIYSSALQEHPMARTILAAAATAAVVLALLAPQTTSARLLRGYADGDYEDGRSVAFQVQNRIHSHTSSRPAPPRPAPPRRACQPRPPAACPAPHHAPAA